jgi:type I restriction enzyme S subunit
VTDYPEVELRFLSTLPIENGTDVAADSGNPQEWIRYIRTTDIMSLTKLAPEKRVTVPDHIASLAVVQRDDILMTRAGATVGKAYIHDSDEPACFAGYLVRWRIDRRRAVPRYMAYWTQSKHFADQVALGVVRSTIDNYSASKYRSTRAPVPPIDEQRRIAEYLDRETAQIDALIAKQEQLIHGLLERRESLVGHAVFSGLRGAALRDNDEAWLPPTPATWPVTQLGFVTDTLAGYAFPSEGFTSKPSDTRLLRGINVKPGVIDWSEVVYWDENLNPVPSRYRLEPGDLVLGMDRPFIGAGIRVASISEYDAPSLLLQRVMRIRPLVNSDRGYLRHLFSTRSFYMYLEPMFTGVSVPHISEWQVRKYRIPLPPTDEQREIARYLDRKTAEIGALIAKAREFIALARERRAALITEAVTGRIDASTGNAREGA